MSIFDPAVLLDAVLTEPTERREPLIEGDYPARIGKITAAQWTGKKDPTKSGVRWDIQLHVNTTPEQQAEGYAPEIIITDGVMLDTTPSGTIDNTPGKNSRLKAYREACDMNKPGDIFSARKMEGMMILVKIKHELYQENIYEKIGSVTKY